MFSFSFFFFLWLVFVCFFTDLYKILHYKTCFQAVCCLVWIVFYYSFLFCWLCLIIQIDFIKIQNIAFVLFLFHPSPTTMIFFSFWGLALWNVCCIYLLVLIWAAHLFCCAKPSSQSHCNDTKHISVNIVCLQRKNYQKQLYLLGFQI